MFQSWAVDTEGTITDMLYGPDAIELLEQIMEKSPDRWYFRKLA